MPTADENWSSLKIDAVLRLDFESFYSDFPDFLTPAQILAQIPSLFLFLI